MKRALSALMVVTAGGATSQLASADPGVVAVAPKPAPAPQPRRQIVKPRLLPTGAPACGNVMFKSYVPPDPLCPVFDNLRDLEEMGRKYSEELHNLDVKTAALTVQPKGRPDL